MKFWDASAIVPLVLTEPTTKAVQTLAEKDPTLIVWWATEVECASAIARLERDDALDDATAIPPIETARADVARSRSERPSPRSRRAVLAGASPSLRECASARRRLYRR